MFVTDEDRDRLKGMFFGLPVGDALGTAVEFKDRDTFEPVTGMRGGGAFNLQVGEWTDDTSMALALGQTLIDHGMNRIELLKNFTRWYKYGKFSHNGRCFDIGNTTRTALDNFIRSQGTEENPASTDEWDSGNGGIMRLAPAVVWAWYNYPLDWQIGDDIDMRYDPKARPPHPMPTGQRIQNYSMHAANWQSEATHASPECLRIARIMARQLAYAVAGNEWWVVERMWGTQIPQERINVESDGYVTHTWQAAGWAMNQADNFRDVLLTAVNLGDDADTVGAVTGQVAGAIYGYKAIPEEWLEVLAWRDQLEEMFEKLCVRREE